MAAPNDVLTYENNTIVYIPPAYTRILYGFGVCFIGTLILALLILEILYPKSSPAPELPLWVRAQLPLAVVITLLLITVLFVHGIMIFEMRCDLKTGRYDCVSGFAFHRIHRTGTFDEFARVRLRYSSKNDLGCMIYIDWKKWWKAPTSIGFERSIKYAHLTLYRVAADLHIPAVGVKSYLKQHPEALNQPGKRPASVNHFDLLDHPDPPEHHNVTMHVVDRSKGTD